MAAGLSLVCPVSQFFSNTKMLFVVLYGLIEIMQLVISQAKIVVGISLVYSVSQLISNSKILFVVLYGLIEIM